MRIKDSLPPNIPKTETLHGALNCLMTNQEKKSMSFLRRKQRSDKPKPIWLQNAGLMKLVVRGKRYSKQHQERWFKILAHYYHDGWTAGDIAEAMGMSQKAVEKVIHRLKTRPHTKLAVAQRRPK